MNLKDIEKESFADPEFRREWKRTRIQRWIMTLLVRVEIKIKQFLTPTL